MKDRNRGIPKYKSQNDLDINSAKQEGLAHKGKNKKLNKGGEAKQVIMLCKMENANIELLTMPVGFSQGQLEVREVFMPSCTNMMIQKMRKIISLYMLINSSFLAF